MGGKRETPLERFAKRRAKAREPKPPGITARLRAAKRRRQQSEDREVYEFVDVRDGKASRVSGEYCGDYIERHHIVFRSQGGLTTTANVISVTPQEHLEIHRTRTLRLSGNADTVTANGLHCGVLVERHDGERWVVIKRC